MKLNICRKKSFRGISWKNEGINDRNCLHGLFYFVHWNLNFLLNYYFSISLRCTDHLFLLCNCVLKAFIVVVAFAPSSINMIRSFFGKEELLTRHRWSYLYHVSFRAFVIYLTKKISALDFVLSPSFIAPLSKETWTFFL